mgnify:CR=1 FL=1
MSITLKRRMEVSQVRSVERRVEAADAFERREQRFRTASSASCWSRNCESAHSERDSAMALDLGEAQVRRRRSHRH